MMKHLKLFIFLNLFFCSTHLYAQVPEWTSTELAKANTAKNTEYLTDEEKKVIQLMNLARMDGAKFFNIYIPSFVRKYNSAYSSTIKPNNQYLTSLKKEIVDINNLPLFYPDLGLFSAAEFHASDMGATGKTGHTSSGGEDFSTRMIMFTGDQYGKSENCSYGFEDAIGIVCQLLIDNNVPSLGHRINILRKESNIVGVAIRSHKTYKHNCVMDFGHNASASASTQTTESNTPDSNVPTSTTTPATSSVWTTTEMEKANTAKGLSYLSAEEKKVIQFLNLARINGSKFYQAYIPDYIKQHNATYSSKITSGNKYVTSLKEDISKVENLPLLYANKPLTTASEYHANDMGRKGKIGHSSSNGDSFLDRMKRFTGDQYDKSENCSYGAGDAISIVCQLLIDNDVPSLGHRKNILRKEVNSIGVAIRPHKTYEYNCVMDFGYNSSLDKSSQSTNKDLLSVWTPSEIQKANTAKNVDYLSEAEKQIILFLNLARLDGARFFNTYIPDQINSYNRKYRTQIKVNNRYVRSLKPDLNKIKNLHMLYPNQTLYITANYHATDMGKTGKIGHSSSNGDSFSDRMKKYVGDMYGKSENCSYGMSEPLEIVCQLLIDLDVPSVGHRKNILNPEAKTIGVAIQPHKAYQTNCVMDFSTESPRNP